jgi:methylmalonyl-CoA mutase
MSDFFKPFNAVSKAEWEAQLIADLKGKDPSVLKTKDAIEEIEFSSYAHQEDITSTPETAGNFPYTRGMNATNNEWKNSARISVNDDKTANNDALEALNLGADMLIFQQSNSSTNWNSVLKEIKLEFIETQFSIFSMDAFEQLYAIQSNSSFQMDIQFDFLAVENNEINIEKIAPYYSTKQARFCEVNGFAVQQAGATTWQEIAFCLSTGHEYISKLMSAGFSIDEAAACINFTIGVGANYFYEIAKIRSLKRLWSKVIRAYEPQHACSYNCKINAQIGHSNKSILDPHTNLLRQTTEAMSAVTSGVHSMTILPHDMYSSDGTSVLAQRMAINISTILQEESYLAKVIDPLGGSYSIELLTNQVAEKSWGLFQELDEKGGTIDKATREGLFQAIRVKSAQRIESFTSGKTVGIGMNKFKPTTEANVTWKVPANYLGLPVLLLENELTSQSV